MQLNYRITGEADSPPVIILHGLLGSSRNWTTVARHLAQSHQVFTLDLRNHGKSPHAPEMDFPVLASDLLELMEAHDLAQAHLIGHSLGGKVAMRFAVNHPERVSSLVVVDIAPRQYGLHFQKDFAAMRALDLGSIKNRKQADDALAESVGDWGQRQFLLTNLQRDSEGTYYWAANIDVLAESLPTIREDPLSARERFDGPVLFLYGEKSNFVRPEDHTRIVEAFPQAHIQAVPDAGHNVHAENTSFFNQALDRFYARR